MTVDPTQPDRSHAILLDGFGRIAPVPGVAGVIGIVWGALVCLVERDLKRLIAYSSVAHMGFVALALAAGSEAGLQAALFANIAHGIISAMLSSPSCSLCGTTERQIQLGVKVKF